MRFFGLLFLLTCLVCAKMLDFAHGAPAKMDAVKPSAAKQPVIGSLADKPDCNDENENADFYDQRQNGTSNYRINFSGVVVLVAPPETVLQAVQTGNLGNDMDELLASQGGPTGLKPKAPASGNIKPGPGTLSLYNQNESQRPKRKEYETETVHRAAQSDNVGYNADDTFASHAGQAEQAGLKPKPQSPASRENPQVLESFSRVHPDMKSKESLTPRTKETSHDQ